MGLVQIPVEMEEAAPVSSQPLVDHCDYFNVRHNSRVSIILLPEWRNLANPKYGSVSGRYMTPYYNQNSELYPSNASHFRSGLQSWPPPWVQRNGEQLIRSPIELQLN